MFFSGGFYDLEVTSMPKLCGVPDKPFEVKIVDTEDDVPERTCSRTRKIRLHAEGCLRAFEKDAAGALG